MPIIQSGNNTLSVQYWCQSSENGEENGLLENSVILGKVWRAKKIAYIISGKEVKIIKIQNGIKQ